MTKLNAKEYKSFEKIKHTEGDVEFWFARELSHSYWNIRNEDAFSRSSCTRQQVCENIGRPTLNIDFLASGSQTDARQQVCENIGRSTLNIDFLTSGSQTPPVMSRK